MVVLFLAIVFVLNIGGWRDRLAGRATPAVIRSLAVLPLDNLSRDPDQEYFADGKPKGPLRSTPTIPKRTSSSVSLRSGSPGMPTPSRPSRRLWRFPPATRSRSHILHAPTPWRVKKPKPKPF